MPKCIYCKKNKTEESFKNVEHVIPQAFGRFQPDNLVLNSEKPLKVCDACNNEFSKFERRLARDTFEGYILRCKFGMKLSTENRKRVKITIAEGEYRGLHLSLTENCHVKIIPQIGLKNKRGKWEYILIDNINSFCFDRDKYLLTNDSLVAFDLDNDTAKGAFKKLDITFIPEENFSPAFGENHVKCKIETIIDSIIKRMLSKIAFNYFAYFNFKHILLNSCFDKVRKFILNEDEQVKIEINNTPILRNEPSIRYRRQCHIVIVNKIRNGNLSVQVSLFNHMKYIIYLSENIGSLNVRSDFGHAFNYRNQKIVKLTRQNRIMIPTIKLWTP